MSRRKSAVPPVSLEERWRGCVPSFQEKIEKIAAHAGKETMAVFSMWRAYSDVCINGDQSPLLWEFVGWHAKDLGGDTATLRAIVE